MTFSLKGLKTITNYQYESACGILSLLDIFRVHWTATMYASLHTDRLGVVKRTPWRAVMERTGVV